ncbi:hypothetical protein EDC96DRAFT_498674 [Choanephora cucurbitarum]|nr:hypothetical protein EDC96DRAFT_498674 [Choanephora cucurbitarum]
MANKANAKRKSTNNKSKQEHAPFHDEIQSLQVTFYEIESWIEKTAPLLNRMTEELDRASKHFVKRRRETPEQQTIQLERHLLELQQKNPVLLSNALVDNSQKEGSMQWLLSFQPGNLLRLDTNITSIEQLIEAVQKIKLLQSEESINVQPIESTVTEEDKILELLCSSPSPSFDLPHDASSIEYYRYAMTRRPEISLENYNHCRMNLNGLTENISPAAFNYIGHVFWDCLHPKTSSDWSSFRDRSGDNQRNQACTDACLAVMFLHVMRHDKYICENSQAIAGFYYDRARDRLMEFYDEPADLLTIEILLNLSMFCTICKRYTQTRIYTGLCLHKIMEMGFHRSANLPKDDLSLRKTYLKILLTLLYNDCSYSVHAEESITIDDSQIDVDFYEIIELNQKLYDPAQMGLHDYNKAIVKDTYFVYNIELFRHFTKSRLLVVRGASIKQLLHQEKMLSEWHERLPDSFKIDHDDHTQFKELRTDKEKNIATTTDANALQTQAALLLKIQYETHWIFLHKAILSSIRRSKSLGSESPSFSGQERRSSMICTASADKVVEVCEVLTKCFGWCVFQQTVNCLYHASTVYCGHALVKDDFEQKEKAKVMIHRIMRILESGSLIYEGFPDDMAYCLCEFLKRQGMHDGLECSCKTDIINAATVDSLMAEMTTL